MHHHKRWLFGLLVCLTSMVHADWPQFLGPDRNAKISPGDLGTKWSLDGPELVWRIELGEGFGGPAIKNNHVYLLDRAGAQDRLRCFDLKTGTEHWNYTYDAPGKLSYNGSRSVPTVDDQRVYTIGPFGHFYCIDLKTHKPIWKTHLIKDFGGEFPKFGVSQAPLIYKNWVILAVCGKDVGVVAFDKKTGKIAWQSKAIGPMHFSSPMLANIEGKAQILYMSDKGLFGIAAESGEILWHYDKYWCKRLIPSPLVLEDGRVFITGGYDQGSVMIQVKRKDNQFKVSELWRLKRIGAHIANPILHEGHLYINGNTNTARDGLLCVDLAGNLKWQTKRKPGFERGNFIMVDGKILIVEGREGTLHMVEPTPKGFKQIAQTPVLSGRSIWAPLAYSDGLLLLRDQSQLKCLQLGKK